MYLPIQYTYLVGSLLSFIPWIALFLYRKDLRKMMLVMSLIMAVYGLITEYLFWTLDWWRPYTITQTRVGLEALITGFSVGGVISVIYLVLYSKQCKKLKLSNNILKSVLFLSLHLLGFYVLTYFFRISSFISMLVLYTVSSFFIIFNRRDLFEMSLVSGFLTALGSISIFLTLIAFSPDFVEKTWVFDNLSGLLLLGIPVEDLVFFFLLALFAAPFYFYATNQKIVDKK